jgi:hypothetical protein
MSVDQEFFNELLDRVTAIEQQLANLREWLKRDDRRDTGENADSLKRITGVPADLVPIAYTGESTMFARVSSRFQRRRVCGNESPYTHE